jgi:hypothetical protein
MDFLNRSRNMQALKIRNVVVVAGLSLVTAQMAMAQGVGNLGSLPTTFPLQTPGGWTVGNAAAPVPVVLDPNGPQWGKSFVGPNGGPFSYAPTSTTNPPLNVQEFLQVDPTSPAWTDWHEDVIGIDGLTGATDPNWIWTNPSILVNGSPYPATITGAGTSNLSFLFNPVAPGSTIIIRKQLEYLGTPGQVFFGTLSVHEYPTPEPGSLALLGLASTFILRRRRANAAG